MHQELTGAVLPLSLTLQRPGVLLACDCVWKLEETSKMNTVISGSGRRLRTHTDMPVVNY